MAAITSSTQFPSLDVVDLIATSDTFGVSEASQAVAEFLSLTGSLTLTDTVAKQDTSAYTGYLRGTASLAVRLGGATTLTPRVSATPTITP